MAEFWVYENWRRKRGAIHSANCSYCNHGKGLHVQDSKRNGQWHGPLSREDAFKLATTKPNIEPCKFCQALEPLA